MLELDLSSDQRYLRRIRGFVACAQNPEGRLWLGFALEHQRRQCFEIEDLARQIARGLADENAARLSHRLEALRGVDCVADHGIGTLNVATEHASDDLAGVDADAQAQLRAVLAREILVEPSNRRLH